MYYFNNLHEAVSFLEEYSGYEKTFWKNGDPLTIMRKAASIKESRDKLIETLINYPNTISELLENPKIQIKFYGRRAIARGKYTSLQKVNLIYKIMQKQIENYDYLSRIYTQEELEQLPKEELNIILKEVNINTKARKSKLKQAKDRTQEQLEFLAKPEPYEIPDDVMIRTQEEIALMYPGEQLTKREKFALGIVDEEIFEDKDTIDRRIEIVETILASKITNKKYNDLFYMEDEELFFLYQHTLNKLLSEENVIQLRKSSK